MGQELFLVYMSPDTIVVLLFEHTNVKPLVVHMKAILLIFQEDEDVERIYTTPRSIERWLNDSVNVKCDVVIMKQLLMAS